MFQRIAMTVLATLVCMGVPMTSPALASSEPQLIGYDGHHHHHHHHRYDERLIMPEYDHTYRWRHPMQYGGCTDRDAVRKARAYGFEHARVVEAGQRVVVDGRRFHQRVRLVMLNEPGCPIRR